MPSAQHRLTEVRQLAFGVELVEDLRAPLDAAAKARLRSLFLRHGFLLFRDQNLAMEEQIEIMSAIGDVLHAVDGVGYISTDETKGALGASELIFHSDLDFSPWPLRALSLHAIDVVEDATATRFANARRACALLPEALRERIAPLSLLTALPEDYARENIGWDVPDGTLQVWRAPITPHPETGEPLLAVSQQAVRFDGLEPAESAALIRSLHAILYAPDNVMEHRWRNGDFVIWDNLAFHHARANLTGGGRRTLQRVANGEKSFMEL